MTDRQDRFSALYADHFDPVLGYALRRVEQSADAADVVAETFLVAWRRLGDVPPEPETRLWLYGVARKVLGNHRRGALRRSALGERLRSDLATNVPDFADGVGAEADVHRAMAQLSQPDREVLQLAAWEGLEPREIAHVLDISDLACRSRLSRARSRLRKVLGNDPPGRGHEPSNTPTPSLRTTP